MSESGGSGATVKRARRQVPEPVTTKEETHPEGTVNIWTGRRLKGYGHKEKGPRVPTKYRCEPELDSGWTRGEAAGVSYCCLYFARGLCHHGADCTYLHRVPDDIMSLKHVRDHTVDIFGRDRNPAHRDGRKRGTGSYERECRSLYIHYGGSALTNEEVHARVLREFERWGAVEDIHVVARKPLAFVRYRWRAGAEFAKAAAHQQVVDGLIEPLDVRWANDDPNPVAVQRVHREHEDAVRQAYERAVNEMDPVSKRARLQELHLATTGQYPDTDVQYHAAGHGSYLVDNEALEEAPGGGGWDQYYDAGSSDVGGTAAAATVDKATAATGTEYEDDISRYLTSEELAQLEDEEEMRRQNPMPPEDSHQPSPRGSREKENGHQPNHTETADEDGNGTGGGLAGLLAGYASD